MTPSVRAAGGREGQQEQHHCHHQQQRGAVPPRRRRRPRAAATVRAQPPARVLLHPSPPPPPASAVPSRPRTKPVIYPRAGFAERTRPASLHGTIGRRSSRRSYAAGSNPGGRVLAERRGSRACAPATRREAEANVDVFSAAAAPRPPVCFGADAAPSLAAREPRWRRRGVGAAINRAPAASGAERLPT